MKCFFKTAVRWVAIAAIVMNFSMIHAVAAVKANQDLSQKAPVIPSQANLPRVDLVSLEEHLESTPEVLIAVAELEEKRNLLVREQARSGLDFKLHAGVGSLSEIESSDGNRDYDTGYAGMRLRYPILGRMEEQRISSLKAEARAWESQSRVELVRRRALAALRSNYATYWACQEQLALIRAFLDAEEDVTATLKHRTATGHLLDADLQEFLTVFDLVRRNGARFAATQGRALRSIRLLTRAPLSDFRATPPNLTSPDIDLELLRTEVLQSYPEIVLYRGLVDEHLGVLELTRWGDLKGYAELSGFTNYESPPDESGYGVDLRFTVDFPALFAKANDAKKKAVLSALRKSQYELELRSSETLANAEDAWRRIHNEQENLAFSRQRLIAALERVRLSTLRLEEVPGDTIEALEKNRFQYFLAASDYIEAKAILYRQKAELTQYLEEKSGVDKANSDPDTGEKPATVIHKDYLRPLWCMKVPAKLHPDQLSVPLSAEHSWPATATGFSAYVWNSAKLLAQAGENPLFWQELQDMRLNRLLISFDRSHLDALKREPEKKQLNIFLQEAARQDIVVNLLLGEPSWILPEFRSDLLTIVQQMAPFSFSGLHLDLEPNQLNSEIYSESYLLAQLLATVQAVRHVSPWPVGLSIHPRYLDARRTKLCLGCALESLSLDEVALMIYNSRPETVAGRYEKLAREFPEISFSVAQSVEPILTSEESYSSCSRKEFFAAMERLREDSASQNLAAIIVQSWEDFEKMTFQNKDGSP